MLLEVPGLGPWSADIYYLMALRRPDIWPQGDLALASALQDVKRLNARPTRDEQQVIANAWAPWRSVAARIVWAHYLAARGQLGRPDPEATLREDRGSGTQRAISPPRHVPQGPIAGRSC
jgi:3-methyladenine DNA glycosylase/8-oxoguanine DNA glycosylase